MKVKKQNTGDQNTGDWNAGYRNAGYSNAGDKNTGNRNAGDQNTGHQNNGNWNTGNWNTGNQNTGNLNNGNWNTGNWNTGNWNTGNWNTGNWNTGYFNTTTPDQVNIFDVMTSKEDWNNCSKPNFIYFHLTVWVPMSEMTDKEKEENPEYGNTEGYLKRKGYQEAFKESYSKASEEDRKKIFNIPNFNADKFLEISGIDVRVDSEQEEKKKALIAKANELIEQAKNM